MEDLYKAITEYPVIVQGALGSALFAFLFFIGKKTFQIIDDILSKYFKQVKLESLIRLQKKYIGLKAHRSKDLLKSSSIRTELLYVGFRNFINGVIWILLGLILDLYETIGYLGGIYYMFKALYSVQKITISDDLDIDKKIKEISEQIKKLNV